MCSKFWIKMVLKIQDLRVLLMWYRSLYQRIQNFQMYTTIYKMIAKMLIF